MNIDQLRKTTKYPVECNNSIPLITTQTMITGLIDWPNVFNKMNYPNLNYEKFRIIDKNSILGIEVWVIGKDSAKIFENIYKHQDNKALPVYIKGTLSAFDIHAAGKCIRDIKITLQNIDDLIIPTQEAE